MSAPRSRPFLLVVLAAAAGGALWQTRTPPERAVMPAVIEDDFTALSGRAAAATPELWERLKAMGVDAVVLREETAAELAGRGEAMHFSRAEVEKWRALGLVAAGGGPNPDTIWAKDAQALARLSSALAARGIDASTAPAPGAARALELPPGVDLARVPAGFDPETVSVVSAAGLIPVAASTTPFAMVAGRRFWVRALPAGARTPLLLRAIHGRAMRLLVLRPDPAAGLDPNLERLRATLRTVKSAGVPSVPAAAAPAPPLSRGERAVRLFLVFGTGVMGPLLARMGPETGVEPSLLVANRVLPARFDAEQAAVFGAHQFAGFF